MNRVKPSKFCFQIKVVTYKSCKQDLMMTPVKRKSELDNEGVKSDFTQTPLQ